MLAARLIDPALGVLFVVAYLRTPEGGHRGPIREFGLRRRDGGRNQG